MYKKVLSCVLAISLAICVSAKEKSIKQQIHEDFLYFKECITQAYVNYDEAKKDYGFDIDDCIKEAEKMYLKKSGRSKEIDRVLISYCINTYFYDHLGFVDEHFGIKAQSDFVNYFDRNYANFTNIFFEKKDDDFFVYSSDELKIRKNDKYTGNQDSLKKCIHDGKILYRYIVMDKSDLTETEISINGNTYKIKCFFDGYANKEDWFTFKETDKSLYFALKDCMYIPDALHQEEYNKITEQLISISPEKNIILDLRSNMGGDKHLLEELLIPMFYKVEYKDFNNYNTLSNIVYSGSKTLNSLMISEAKLKNALKYNYSLESMAYFKNEVEEQKKNPKRYYSGLENLGYNFLPQNGNEKLNGTLYILLDRSTASAAEHGIAFSYLFNRDKVVLIGTNSGGALESGGAYTYTLPNSKVEIELPSRDYRKSTLLINNPHWNGDSKGFYPDYWTTNGDLIPTLQILTGDDSVPAILDGIKNGQL